MLVALTSDANLFVLTADLCPTELKNIRQTTRFYCPQCKNKLQLKVGQVKIPHFAHIHASLCENAFSEGESTAHLLGKQQLFTFFSKQTNAVQLESYIHQLKQRPDLLVTHGNQQYAIEFQCTSIPTVQIQERTAGYVHFQIHPLWLVKTPEQLQKQGIMKLSLSEFYQQFITHYKNDKYLLTYDPEKCVFTYFSNLHYLQGNMWIGKVQSLSIEHQKFPFFVPKRLTIKEYKRLWIVYQMHRDRFVKSRLLLSRSGVNDLFLRSIYELRLARDVLPKFIGIPVFGSESIPLFGVEWQLNLFHFLHVTNLKLTQLNDQAIHAFMRSIKLPDDNIVHQTVSRYIAFLRKIGVHYIHTEIEDEEIFSNLYSEYIAFLQGN